MKKILSIVLATALLATSLAACSSKPAESGTTDAPAVGETKTLKVAALESAYGANIWTEIAAAYEAKTGTKVELVVDKSLEDVIGTQMKSGNYPDVVHLATGRPAGLTETMIKDNALEDLTDMLSLTIPGEDVKVSDKIAGGFTESSLTNPYGDGKTYLAPMFYGPCGLFYDSNLLKTKGWDLPTTWDEMWALGDKAKAEGIALFTYPTAGYFDTFFYALVYEVGGAEFFNDVTTYAEGVWDTDNGKTVLDIITKLATYTEKSTPSNANNDNFTKNQQLVLDNKAIFMPNGNWVIGEMKDAPRTEGFEWGFTALPAVTKGGDQYSYTWFEQIWVPAEAENKDEAKNFIAYLYSDEAAAIFATKGDSVAVQPIVGFADKLEGDNKIYYSVYDNGAKAALGNFAATDPVEGVSIADSVFEAVNSLVSGDKTAAQYKEGIVKASDALRAALK